MRDYKLDFCLLTHHDNGILEIVVNEGVEINAAMANEFLDKIDSIKPKVTHALVNRKNQYSYSFKANFILASSKVIDCVAVVKYKKRIWPLNGVLFPKFYNLAFFDNVESATKWLLDKQNDSE